jgi:hypothetical protein
MINGLNDAESQHNRLFYQSTNKARKLRKNGKNVEGV